MFADHAAKGLLKSGSTVKAALRIVEQTATEFLDTLLPKIAGVSREEQSFEMVVTELTLLMTGWDSAVKKAVRVAEGGVFSGPQPSAVAREADRLYLELRQRILQLAAVRRFDFTRSVTPASEAAVVAASPTRHPTLAKNKGGAPLAAHWDEMWADIAVQLWTGDLQPKRQKDISDAMFDWLGSRNLDAGNTAVTARARALWSKIEPALKG